jgi:hypothetical protein
VKKHLKKFKILYIVFGIVAVLIIGAIITLTSAKNLGVKYTKADVNSVNTKLGINYASLSSSDNSLKIEGSKILNTEITETELTALLNQPSKQWKDYPVANVQIKINDDGSVEMTGKILVDKFKNYAKATNMPAKYTSMIEDKMDLVPINPSFDYKGTYEIKNGKLEGELTELKIGSVEIPKEWTDNNKELITDFIDDRLHSAGMNVQSANFNNGKLNIQGTIPESISFEN